MAYMAIGRHKGNPAQCPGPRDIRLQMMKYKRSSKRGWAGSREDIRGGWERTASEWAEADGFHTSRQGDDDVERVWALQRQTSQNPGSMYSSMSLDLACH